MKYKKLGTSSLLVSEIGLGCMGMSEFYGATNEQESIKTIHYALSQGVNFLDTADQYGLGRNEELVGKAIKKVSRDKVVVATKFGIKRLPHDPAARIICNDPEYIKEACELSLKRLNTEYIDLYYVHRLDKSIPIEDTVGVLASLVKAGKIKYIGLSEVSAQTLQRGHKVHPISALQTEYSLWSRDAEQEILPLCEQLQISFVAYSPLGRGFLSGQIKSLDDLAQDDFRRSQPRFAPENFQKNLELVKQVEQIAARKKVTPAQLALAWVIHQSPQIIPIPGTKSINRLNENISSVNITLSTAEINQLNSIFGADKISGNRYNDFGMQLLNL